MSSGANTSMPTVLCCTPMSMVRAGSMRWLKKPLTMSVNTTPAVTSTGASSIARRTGSGAGGAGIDAQEFRCTLVDQAFAPHQRGVRHDVGRQQRLELVDGIEPMDQQVGQHRQLVVADEFGCGSVNNASARGLVPPV